MSGGANDGPKSGHNFYPLPLPKTTDDLFNEIRQANEQHRALMSRQVVALEQIVGELGNLANLIAGLRR